MAESEFSKIVRVDRLKPAETEALTLEATVGERAALARRFGLEGLDSLSAALGLTPAKRGEVMVTGTLRARVVQTCVVTLEPVETDLEIPVHLRFVPERLAASAAPAHDIDGEALADEDGEDVEAYAASEFDLGEALAQILSTHLPLYPRKPGAAWTDRQWTPEGERGLDERGGDPADNPFAKLAKLRKDGEGDG